MVTHFFTASSNNDNITEQIINKLKRPAHHPRTNRPIKKDKTTEREREREGPGVPEICRETAVDCKP